ncbi:MAG: DNA mismatch endonuclease Vsr [Rhizobiales bacterium]|nr:DNA mismatch endonuclease Vsr [Hyphomicrobiales bacterium]
MHARSGGDFLTPAERSERMARVRGKHTAPELIVRRLLHGMGYRYRLHRRELPGSPDIVFPSRKKSIFVHGCFWHRHAGCRLTTMPRTHADFWQAKFASNIARDRRNVKALEELGWIALVVWQCETRESYMLAGQFRAFLDGTGQGDGRSGTPQ